MRRILWSLLVVVGLATTSQAAPILADVVFVVDESGSMGGVQANVRNNIGAFASILSAGGVDAQYALIGYGNSTVRPRLLTNLTTPGGFATAAQNLVINGGTEPAYEGIMAALNGGPTNGLGINYRSGAVKNIIIITDERSNGDLSGANYANANTLLKSNNALLNGILSNDALFTLNGQGLPPLVTGNGGFVFDLNKFNTTNQAIIDAFVQDFASRKLQEIINVSGNGVPEPATLAVFGGVSLAGFVGYRRRKAKA